jgi:hypothetical protein
MFKDKLKQYVEDNPKLVTMRESESHPGLYVLKYKKRVFYDSLWNDHLEECRGTIVDKDFNVVSRPFTKIYNYGVEEKAPVLSADTRVDAFRKINGFMVAVTWYKDDILVSTTGSTDNDYVNMARSLIDLDKYRHVCREWHGTTFMFECVHRNDPHIIREEEGMYLLGYRETSWDSKIALTPSLLRMLTKDFGSHPVGHLTATMGELITMSKTAKHEGFVFYTADGVSAKIKSPYYLTAKWVARNPRTDKLLTKEFKEQIDEEYYGLLSYIRENIASFTLLTEQDRLQFIRDYLSL